PDYAGAELRRLLGGPERREDEPRPPAVEEGRLQHLRGSGQAERRHQHLHRPVPVGRAAGVLALPRLNPLPSPRMDGNRARAPSGPDFTMSATSTSPAIGAVRSETSQSRAFGPPGTTVRPGRQPRRRPRTNAAPSTAATAAMPRAMSVRRRALRPASSHHAASASAAGSGAGRTAAGSCSAVPPRPSVTARYGSTTPAPYAADP